MNVKEECLCCGTEYSSKFMKEYILKHGMCQLCDADQDDDWTWDELQDTD